MNGSAECEVRVAIPHKGDLKSALAAVNNTLLDAMAMFAVKNRIMLEEVRSHFNCLRVNDKTIFAVYTLEKVKAA